MSFLAAPLSWRVLPQWGRSGWSGSGFSPWRHRISSPSKTIAPGGAVRAHIDMLLERIPRTTLQTVVVTNTGGQADAARLNRLCAGIMPHNRRTRLYSWAEAQKNGGGCVANCDFF